MEGIPGRLPLLSDFGARKQAATVYAKFGDPRVQNEHGQPILFAAQFYGSGRMLYFGSPEMWRLRAVDEAFFERFWTKAIREVGQGRLQRGTARGLLLLERSQYALGQTIRIRANLLDPQLNPLEVDVGRAECVRSAWHSACRSADRSTRSRSR